MKDMHEEFCVGNGARKVNYKFENGQLVYHTLFRKRPWAKRTITDEVAAALLSYTIVTNISMEIDSTSFKGKYLRENELAAINMWVTGQTEHLDTTYYTSQALRGVKYSDELEEFLHEWYMVQKHKRMVRRHIYIYEAHKGLKLRY